MQWNGLFQSMAGMLLGAMLMHLSGVIDRPPYVAMVVFFIAGWWFRSRLEINAASRTPPPKPTAYPPQERGKIIDVPYHEV